jgi:hypothetical protein
LTFGRYEAQIYAYSGWNTQSAITLLDVNGTSIWNIIISDDSTDSNTFLEYKSINSATDMVIATSG